MAPIRIAPFLLAPLLLLGGETVLAQEAGKGWTNPEGPAGKIRVIRGAERGDGRVNIIRGTPNPPAPAPSPTVSAAPIGIAAALATSPRKTTALLEEDEALWIVPRRGLPTACYFAPDLYGVRAPVCTRAVRRTTVFGGW
jgi:hypothetical protein